ncbi:MAG: RtcB family protein [candidate division Zixibacteria bacterium]
MTKLEKISENIWEVPASARLEMNVPARILSSEKLIGGIDEKVIGQITNVACLPGIYKYAICMPDAHLGYGFPIGGVAAFDAEDGVISPGGIGFDINCGMRLIRTNLTIQEIKPKLSQLIDELFKTIPSGVGSKGLVRLNRKEYSQLMLNGSKWCLENGRATELDIENTETEGWVEGADVQAVSEKAANRGLNQMGTLGSGNHYLEIEVVRKDGIIDKNTARGFGISEAGQVVIAVHCGSRGFGHQIATDYLKIFTAKRNNYKLNIKDRELAAAPIKSPEGRAYYSAMACAANSAFANRQIITHYIRKVFENVFGLSASQLELETVYDVAHNIARFENYNIDGQSRKVLVHRKGATRSFGPGNSEIPEAYRALGQPVIVGGSMESGSALFVGTEKAENEYFGSTVHGSGRVMSRSKAKKKIRGDELQRDMLKRGITVKTGYLRGLAEEAGFAYKNIDEVSNAVNRLGLSKIVARFYPVANIKG